MKIRLSTFFSSYTIISVIVLFFSITPAWGEITSADHIPLQNNINDLDAEKDAEEMEVMDQQLLEQAARSEAINLERQSKTLEEQIRRLRSESERLNHKTQSQSDRYKQALTTLKNIQIAAQGVRAQRNKIKNELEKLKNQTDALEQRVSEKKTSRHQAHQEIARLSRENKQLLARKRKAEIAIEKLNRGLKNLRTQNQRLSENNLKLNQQVIQLEARRDRLR